MTDRKHEKLLVELLRLYMKYGEGSFRELAQALRRGELIVEISELSEAIPVAFGSQAGRLRRRTPSTSGRRGERQKVLEQLGKLQRAETEKERLVGSLGRAIAEGTVFQDTRKLRGFGRDLGVDVDGVPTTRWRLLDKIVGRLLAADIDYVRSCANAAEDMAKGGSQLKGWAGIIVKEP